MPGQDSSTPGLTCNYPNNSTLKFQPCLPSGVSLRHTAPVRNTSASACGQKPRQGWAGTGGKRVAASQDWAFVPASFKSCFSTWTSYIRINPHQSTLLQAYSQQHTQDRDLYLAWGGGEVVPRGGGGRGGVEGGSGRIRLRAGLGNTVSCTCYVNKPQAACYLTDSTGTTGAICKTIWINKRVIP